MFVLSSQDNWEYAMFAGMDAQSRDLAPVVNVNPVISLYYIAFMVVGSFFVVQLFVGVFIDTFQVRHVHRDEDVDPFMPNLVDLLRMSTPSSLCYYPFMPTWHRRHCPQLQPVGFTKRDLPGTDRAILNGRL